ncbi:hypothetical protein [Citrobacter freundii]|uniref:Uncharacterized protein n=2 Tax=Citrobacter freundii TaxID=546 RepID=A0AAN4IHU5_CITFR|nr:hypothetical protein [Citrobacter freundii]ASG44344.1 hypothetical protein CES93_12205 [Citrobacter freundii]EIJ8976442.1 hypothetical protein [Citrobacter freundii]EIJ8981526.1 hypothetical protein [Citrobacter freundii]EJD5388451.1 hypothetical protein [Citrobacter freundii]EJG9718476.1 hypothetical protein [Citrobacter freundii]
MDEKVMALATLQAAQEAANWAFWSMIGTWVAGIATFLAVCVSLHLGLKKPKAHISCRVNVGITWQGPYQKKGVTIVITNLALHTVKVTSINWTFKKDITFYQPFHSPLSMQLPQKLDYGEQATFWIDIDGNSEWIEKIALGLKEQDANPKDFRCVISVTTGESFTFEIEKTLMDKITSSYHQISKTESHQT